MKISRFLNNGEQTYGIVKDGKVSTRDEVTYATGVPVPHSIKDFLFDGWYQEIIKVANKLPYNENLSEYEILPPISRPSKIICLAYNYLDHAKEQGQKTPTDPSIVIKPRTALCGAGSDISCPYFVKQLDYEVELAVVIKKKCKNVSTSDAMGMVFGYMVFNDISARDIQFMDKQFTRGKSFDTFAPCGPWVTTADEILDIHNLKMTTKINGEIRQNSNTCNMAIKIPQIISKISKVMTLEKGDIISTGTPAGVVLGNPDLEFLKDGDVIEMEIESLGVLQNTVRFAESVAQTHNHTM